MGSDLSGVLLIDKPTGMTSHDVVDRVRRITRQRRAGHCGTLDPSASGLLVVCLGRATKIVQYLTGHAKTYRAEITLGQATPSYDADTLYEAGETKPIPDMDFKTADHSLAPFRGNIQQQVPPYSAVHVGGKRLHELSRKGISVATPSREVEVHRLELMDYTPPKATVEVACSAGTYVRSIAHDWGTLLGCGGYLSSLRRTVAGRFSVADARSLSELESLTEAGSLPEVLLPVEDALEFAALVVTDSFAARVSHGPDLERSGVCDVSGSFAPGDTVLLKDQLGRALAIGLACRASEEIASDDEGPLFRYARVLN